MTQAYNLAILANAVDTSGRLNVGTNATGTLPVANGGTGTTTPSLVAGTGISITGSFPNQTVTATGGGGATYIGARGQVFTGSGTFTIPTSITAIKVTAIGAGGGGVGSGGGNASTGGNTTVTSGTQTITTIQGNGGTGGLGQNPGGTGGGTSGGDIAIRGSNGGTFGGAPGATFFSNGLGGGGYGNGGQGQQGTGCDPSFASGGGGGSAIKFLTGLTSGNTLSVTIGSGGAGAGGGPAGGAGIVVIEW